MFEKMPEYVKLTEDQLAEGLKSGDANALIAITEDGIPAGINFYFFGYSTWVGQVIS